MRSASSGGFTLLEAAVALAIVGLAAVAALGAVGAELRIADRSRHALVAAALAEDRLTALALLGADELRPLADSLGRGRFRAPFEAYAWRASAREVVGEDGLVELAVEVEWQGGSYGLGTRLYRPPRRVEAP